MSPNLDERRALAERLFLAREEADRIMAALDAPAQSPAVPNPFQAFAGFVSGGAEGDFRVDSALQPACRRFLARTGPAYAPRLAAAASPGLAQTREGEGCRISLRPSRADAGQVYVVVELTRDVPSGALPRTLVLLLRDGTFSRFALPEPDGNLYQMLAEADSSLVQNLALPETEVFLH